jgi:chorismate mutase
MGRGKVQKMINKILSPKSLEELENAVLDIFDEMLAKDVSRNRIANEIAKHPNAYLIREIAAKFTIEEIKERHGRKSEGVMIIEGMITDLEIRKCLRTYASVMHAYTQRIKQ